MKIPVTGTTCDWIEFPLFKMFGCFILAVITFAHHRTLVMTRCFSFQACSQNQRTIKVGKDLEGHWVQPWATVSPKSCPQVPHSGMVTPPPPWSVPVPEHPFSEKIFPNFWSKKKKTFLDWKGGQALESLRCSWGLMAAGLWQEGNPRLSTGGFGRCRSSGETWQIPLHPLLLCSKCGITPKALEFALHSIPWTISQKPGDPSLCKNLGPLMICLHGHFHSPWPTEGL